MTTDAGFFSVANEAAARALGVKRISMPNRSSKRQRAQIVIELRLQYSLAALLRGAGLARSTFYYQLAALQATDKYATTKDQIKAIYDRHKGRYGYRRHGDAASAR